MTVPLHILFEQCAQKSPDANALIHEDVTLSYRQLDHTATQLARHLSQQGVAQGSFVHLYITRSPDLIITILAVLKCGAAYVPLETNYPQQRLSFLFADLESSCIITRTDLQATLPEVGTPLVLIDEVNLDTEHPFISVVPDMNQTCVVLYTSGSTGQPKGVKLHHAGLCNRLLWEQGNTTFTENDVVLQHASISFDFSLWEIFTALLNSACLIMPRKKFSYEGSYLAHLIIRHNITVMGSVPSLLSLLIEDPEFTNCTSLKRVVSGGEVLSVDFQNRFFEKSNAELINIYGPTEASISVLHWHCQRNSKDKKVPIGHPVAGMDIYLLDEKMQAVTRGEEGELFIAGIGVASGYHDRESLDEQRFVSDIFFKDSDRKMYRTGDICRQRNDGAYEYIGRKDNQVKIRGLRVELEEIECTLNAHPEVRECVVAVPDNHKGNQKLIAWVVMNDRKTLDANELRKYMSHSLPYYMVPVIFQALEKLPLTPNGKINRQALNLDKQTIVSSGDFSATENLLKDIWQDILNTEVNDVNSHFFDCGGDSLACLELSVRIEKQTGLSFPLSLLYQADTIHEQAQRLENGDNSEAYARVFNINHTNNNTGKTLIIVSAIGGNLSGFSELKAYLTDYEILGISSPMFYDSKDIIKDIASSQCEALLSYNIKSGIVLAGFSVGGLIAQELARQLKSYDIKVENIILMDTGTPDMVLKFEKDSLSKVQRLLNIWGSIASRNVSDTIKFLREGVAKRWRKKNQLNSRPKVIAQLIRNRKARLKELSIKAVRQYQLNIYDDDLTLIRARDQVIFSSYDISLGWKEFVGGSFQIESVAGSHASMLIAPNVADVAAIVENLLMKEALESDHNTR